MAKIRKTASIENGLMEVLKILNEEEVQAAIGKGTSYIRKCSNPDLPQQIDHNDSFLLDKACIEKGNTWIQKKSDKDKKSGISKKYPDAKEVDINENGKIDTWFLDEDKNGRYEKALIDLNEDGIIEIVAFDENENKNFEMFFYDKDLDGNADEAEFDEDDDGTIDIIAYDFNQDGEWDKFKEVG